MKELWKYSYAWASFTDAIRFAEKALQIYHPENDMILKALMYSIITSYARPFKQKKSMQLSDNLISSDHRKCHEFLMELRDKVISHQDPVTTKTDFGYFNQVRMYYTDKDNWRFTTIHPRITPQKCKEIIGLASCLLAKCDDKIDELFNDICSSRKLEKGEYIIEPIIDKGDRKFVLKRM